MRDEGVECRVEVVGSLRVVEGGDVLLDPVGEEENDRLRHDCGVFVMRGKRKSGYAKASCWVADEARTREDAALLYVCVRCRP